MNKKSLWIRLRLFSLLFVLFSFSGCEFFTFNGDIKESVYTNLQVTYSFYEIANPNTDHVDLTFQVGQMVPVTSFPQFTQEENLLIGWRFFKYSNVDYTIPPEGLYYGDRNMLTAITVGAAPLSFYAVWARKRYINFVTNCDAEFESIIVPDGYQIPNPYSYYNLTKEKHAFRGWYTDAECTQPFDIKTAVVTSDLTLYAKWVLQVTVTLDPNDGTGQPQSSTFDVGESFSLPDYLYDVPAGKGFVGWASTPDATTAEYLYEDTISSVDDDMTLYSVWTTNIANIVYYDNAGLNNTYTLTKYGVGARIRIGYYREFDVNTGKNYLRDFSNLWLVRGQSIKRYGPSSTSTINDSDTYYEYQRVELTGSMSLYAIWGLKTYGIEYMVTNPANQKRTQFYRIDVDWGTKLTPPEEVPYAAGYVFTGWYWYHNGYNTPYDFDMILNEDNIGNEYSWLQLEAHFEAGSSVQTVFYVGSNDTAVKDGTLENPYLSITDALNAINARGNNTPDYKIVIKDNIMTLRDNINISTFYGNSLTIKYKNTSWNADIYPKLDTTGNTISSPILSVGIPKTVTVENINFYDAESATDGGAVCAQAGSTVILKNCRFYDNHSDGNGGAIYIAPGASVSINNLSLSSNNNSTGNGGLIYNGGTLTLNGSIRNNSYYEKNGDIYLATGKYINVSAGFIESESSSMKITIPAADYVADTKILEIAASAPANTYQKFTMQNSSWYVDSNGRLQAY